MERPRKLRLAAELIITEAVLTEVGNALSICNRAGAARFIRSCYTTRNVAVVPVDTALLEKAVELYAAREDKGWGLTDCISFVVMRERDIIHAATGDQHFRQAGFIPLLLEPA